MRKENVLPTLGYYKDQAARWLPRRKTAIVEGGLVGLGGLLLGYELLIAPVEAGAETVPGREDGKWRLPEVESIGDQEAETAVCVGESRGPIATDGLECTSHLDCNGGVCTVGGK